MSTPALDTDGAEVSPLASFTLHGTRTMILVMFDGDSVTSSSASFAMVVRVARASVVFRPPIDAANRTWLNDWKERYLAAKKTPINNQNFQNTLHVATLMYNLAAELLLRAELHKAHAGWLRGVTPEKLRREAVFLLGEPPAQSAPGDARAFYRELAARHGEANWPVSFSLEPSGTTIENFRTRFTILAAPTGGAAAGDGAPAIFVGSEVSGGGISCNGAHIFRQIETSGKLFSTGVPSFAHVLPLARATLVTCDDSALTISTFTASWKAANTVVAQRDALVAVLTACGEDATAAHLKSVPVAKFEEEKASFAAAYRTALATAKVAAAAAAAATRAASAPRVRRGAEPAAVGGGAGPGAGASGGGGGGMGAGGKVPKGRAPRRSTL